LSLGQVLKIFLLIFGKRSSWLKDSRLVLFIFKLGLLLFLELLIEFLGFFRFLAVFRCLGHLLIFFKWSVLSNSDRLQGSGSLPSTTKRFYLGFSHGSSMRVRLSLILPRLRDFVTLLLIVLILH